MKTPLLLFAAAALSACDRPAVIAVPAPAPSPVAVPGPPGPPGATGSTGQPGGGTTVIVVPAASAPRP
jgi:hypothetical protein